MTQRILFTNLGYARGIDGTLRSHLRGARHYMNCPPEVQMRALEELRDLAHAHQADVICIAEIDAGSSNNRYFDQIHFLRDQRFAHGIAVNKYGPEKGLDRVALSRGKSNGYLSVTPLQHRLRFLADGTKKLVCQLELGDGREIWFGHFSLRPWIRRKQFMELASWVKEAEGDLLILGDFNNYRGAGELLPLTDGAGLRLMNPAGPTFRFSGYQASVDLCLASRNLVEHVHVRVIPQRFSDHDALLIEIR